MIKPPDTSPTATPPSKGSAPEPKDSRQGADLTTAIGRELKSLFDAVATEPVPDRFRELLDELERKVDKS